MISIAGIAMAGVGAFVAVRYGSSRSAIAPFLLVGGMTLVLAGLLLIGD